MTTNFDFHLFGAEAPEGELDADDLIALVESVQEIATRIGRIETNAERLGRAPRRTQRVARLTIGLSQGSTTMRVHRSGINDTLDFDSDEEEAFDEKFADLVESFGRNERPIWVGDSLSRATSRFIVALQNAARAVDFVVGGELRSSFETGRIQRDLWEVAAVQGPEQIDFVGTLFSANLLTHRLQVEDFVGNRIPLPAVADDVEAGRLLGTVVRVTGTPEYDSIGQLSAIRRASVVAAADSTDGLSVAREVPLADILRSAPGPDPDGGLELSDEEFDAFLEAVRG